MRVLRALAVVFTLVVVGCSSDDPADPAGSPEARDASGTADVEITEANNGETVSLQSGQTLLLVLEQTPGTGYHWEPDAYDENVLSMTDDQLIPPAETAPGVTYSRELLFRAVGTGSTQLRLQLFPPGEGRPAEEEFAVTVTVA